MADLADKKASKAQRREAARKARLEEQKRRQRAKKKRQAIVIGIILVVLVAGGVFGFVRSQAGKVGADELRAAGCEDVEELEEQKGEHIDSQPPPERVPYNSEPPTSGQHRGGGTAPWGIHDEQIEPELYVHNLEHGGIIIHHNDLPDDELEGLEDLVDSYPVIGQGTGVVLMANPDVESPIVMTAWARMQTCERYNEKVVRAFIKEYCEQGPEKFPLGC